METKMLTSSSRKFAGEVNGTLDRPANDACSKDQAVTECVGYVKNNSNPGQMQQSIWPNHGVSGLIQVLKSAGRERHTY